MIGHKRSILLSLSLMAAGAMTISTSALTQRRHTSALANQRLYPTNLHSSTSILKSSLQVNSGTVASVVNDDAKEWELRLYDDETKTWEEVADVLVQVTGSLDPAAFQIMMQANKNGHARIGTKLDYKVATMLNTGLQKQGILSEIIQVIDNDDGSNSEWA